jgi:hypothetical protein
MHRLTRISTYSFQHCRPGRIHKAVKSKVWDDWYDVARELLISVPNSSPPRPSNAGVALAELEANQLLNPTIQGK